MFSKEQLQRFSIRKLTVGTASVLIGVLFLTSWNTNNVYADSRNVTSGESIAKNNNPQEGNPAVNKDNVQIVDNDSTEVSNISDSKSSKVIKSDATKSDIVRDKTTIDDNSGTKVPELTVQANNKQALTTVTEDNGAKVSKTEKYSNSDIKNQSRNSEKTQETTLVEKVDKEKLSSESLIDQKKLDGQVEIFATDPSNYPTKLNGLIGDDKYIYQVLSLDRRKWYSGSKLILSVNRNDPNDKNIYAYVIDGNSESVTDSITIGVDQYKTIPINGRKYQLNNNGSSEVSINGKKEPTQNSSTVTSIRDTWYRDNLPISQNYGLGNTSDGKWSAIGEIVPVYTENSVIKYYYSDKEGNLTEIENSPNVTVNGFTGQEFEINDVGQYKKLILGYYLTSAPTGNFKGTLSQFSGDKYYKKVYYDFDTGTVEYSVLYHQISPDGTMEVGLFDANGYPLTERRVIAPNSSTEFSKYNLTVRNPYVTAAPHEVQFIYKKLGSIIPVDENENPIGDAIQFENNSKDPTKALPGKVPSISGYTPSYELAYELVGDKKVPIKVPISVGDKVVPTDPGENIKVVYTANAQTATITYIDDDTTENKTLGSDKQNGKFNQVITFEHDPAEVIKGLEEKGYKLVYNNFDNQKYNADNSKNQFEVHFSHQTQNVKRNDTVSQTIHYVYDDGTKAEDDNAQTLSFEQHGVQDMVTHDIIWTPSDSQSFTAVTTPTITGYTPDVDQVDGHSVNFGDKDNVITVTYGANAQNAVIKFIDDTTNKTLSTEKADGKFNQVISFEHDPQALIVELQNRGYKLVSNNFNNQKYDSDNTKNQFEVHLVHGTKNVTRTDKVNRTIKYVYTNGQTAQPEVDQVVNFTEDGIQDLVTNDIDWTPAKSQTMDSVTTPELTGYTADKDQVASQIVNFGDSDQVITVTYSANAQQAGIKFIDDTDSKTLDHENANGKFDDEIKFNRDVKDEISQFEGQGYKLVSTNFNNNKYQSDNANNQFEVHFIHGTKDVSRDHNVIQTIHYVLADGTKVFDNNVQTLKFTQPGVQDLVTGKIEWTSIPSQTFTQVASPFKDGYTPDQKVILANTANFDSNDSEIIVTYTTNDQAAGIKYIDDTTGKTLDTHQASGKFGDVIKFSRDVNDEISQFESQNYKLVSNNFDNQKYVSDNTKNQFEVHFVHVTKNVTRTDKVNRTIHYVYSDGKTAEPDKVQVVNFTEDGVQDLVTGNITWTSAKSQKMVSVDTPKLEGYTPDIKSVASQTVNFGDKDLDTTVTYSADAQQLDVAFIDDTTGKTLQTVVKNGHSDEQSGYNTKNDINNYLGEHYKLVSDSTNGNDLVFDHDDKADQHYEVHFVHATKNVTRTDKVNRTIHYVYSDGKTAEPDKVQVVNFTEDGVQDLVTGNITWTSAKSQKMVSVDTPKLEGYTPDIKSVASQTVNFGDKDLDTTVTYSADAQTATITYIDDDTNENKTLGSDKQNGKFNQVITFEHDPAEVIKGLEEKGYKLVSNDFNSNKYQADNSNNVFYVHLKHGTSESSRKDDVNMTVHYVMDDGSKAPSDSKQTVSFTENGIKDNVTGNITWTPATSQPLKDVDSPVLTGYTADIKTANGKAVNFGDPDINVTVHYSANAQTAKITYIDDTTKTNLDSKEANGKFGQAITFEHDPAEVIKGLEEKGYVLVSNSFNKQTYDANNSNNVFYVHLKHGTKNVSRDHNVNMTVHYVMDDGSKAPSDSKQTVSFTESGIQDLVTQKITWTPADSQKFDDVVTPAITGYTPDQDKVAGQTANFDTQDRKVTVTYSPDIQLGRINYIDDNTGKTLTHDDFSGRTNEHEDYTPIDRIKEFENKGYELVSNDYPDGGFNFDDNDQQDQVFNVHLKHGTTTVTPENPGKPGEPVDPDNPDGPKYPDGTDKTGLTDTVNRTITYVMIDGSKAPDAVHDSLSYTASKVIDKVNGEVLETKWSANQNFKDVDSPSVKGYTTNKKTVSNKNVAHDAADITETVKYSADAQKASVTYIDDDNNGNTLKVDNLNGVTNAKSGYTTKAAIDTYTGLGYTLVSDATNGNEVVFDNDDANDQAFTVHLSHGTITVTPENPGKPGEPVDPDNPDGPKYPDGTDEYQVKRTGTQTIHYVGASDKTPADNNQTFIFTREITFDNVTGNIISVTPWNVQSHTFGNVDTPVIPGYHADKAVAGGATVTPDDLNRVITVTYAPDGNPGNPGDQGDTPTPEPTPEPDPTPNPTPDDQPDSEISSDEHFENVKAKDKLDKTNPKKMDAYKKERKIIKTKIAKQDHTEIAEPKLPQTGEADNSIIGLLGMLLASFAAMFGFDSLHSHDKKHKN